MKHYLTLALIGGISSATEVSMGIDSFNQIQLDAHNEYRALHGVPPLVFDAELAAGAQAWSEYLAQQNSGLRHAQNTGLGENLAFYRSSNPAVTRQVLEESSHASDAWYDEINDPGYNFNNPGFTSGIGHFTQMVWQDTQRLGCGVSGSFLTCRYDPPGNYSGQFRQQVLPLVGNTGQDTSNQDEQTEEEQQVDPEPMEEEEAPATTEDVEVPEQIQSTLEIYSTQLAGTTSQCGYKIGQPISYQGGSLNGIRVSCPAADNRAVTLQYTDTADNWSNVIDRCSNALLDEEIDSNTGVVTRTYAAWGPVGQDTVAFWRPSPQSPPPVHSLKLLQVSAFDTDSIMTPASCMFEGEIDMNDEVDENDQTADDEAATELQTQASNYLSDASSAVQGAEIAYTNMQVFDSAMSDELPAAEMSHAVVVDEADKINLAFELAQQLTEVNELRNIRDVQAQTLGNLYAAQAQVTAAYDSAVSIYQNEFTNELSTLDIAATEAFENINNLDLALSGAMQYQSSGIQRAALEAVTGFAAAGEPLTVQVEDVLALSDELRSQALTHLQAIGDVKGWADQMTQAAEQIIATIDLLIFELEEDAALAAAAAAEAAAAEAAANGEEDESSEPVEEEGNFVCMDNDNGALDAYNEGCASYTAQPLYCGTKYDNAEFTANSMCCACGGGVQVLAPEEEPSDEPAVCISDAETPQACLDEWVLDFTFEVRSCFLNEKRRTASVNGESYQYLLYYGGCGDNSVDIWFDRTAEQWGEVLIFTGSNELTDQSTDETRYFNLKSGAQDVLGFRLPADMVNEFSQTGAARGE